MRPTTAHRAAQRLLASAREVLPLRLSALRLSSARETPPVESFARYGMGSWIVPPARVDRPELVAVGSDAVLLEGAQLVVAPGPGVDCSKPLLVLGDRIRLGRFAHVLCTVGVTIGDAVSGSDEVTILDTWAVPGPATASTLPPPAGGPVVIEAGAYLGARSIVGPGVTIGAGAYVGEGAVVLADVPPHTVVSGNPARIVRQWRDESQRWEGGPTS